MKDFNNYINLLHNKEICKYLELTGWIEKSTLFDGKVRQFISPNNLFSVLIPIITEFSDYYRVLIDSLNTIAEYEKKSLTGLFNVLINPTSDIFKWRIADTDTTLGTISFNSMLSNIENIKNLIASTFLDITNPQVFHKKIMTNEVIERIASYKFGQTEIGSYILNLVSPLGFYQYKLFDPLIEELPINRQINLRLMSDINKIQQSVLDKNSVLDEAVSSRNISINFLNTLTKIYDNNKDADIHINVLWDKNVPVVVDNPISHLSLKPTCIDGVVNIIEKYSPNLEQDITKTFYGKIANISGNPDVDNREKIGISIVTIGDDNQKLTVRVELDNTKYSHIVTDAFERGSNIKVTGEMRQSQKSVKLLNAEIEKLD